MSRQRALSLIMKDYKSIFREDFDTPKPVEVISTGSLIIDKVTGVGGIPKGRITEITGDFSTGKTTLALSVASSAQRQGLSVAFFDYEHALSRNYARKLGVDLSPESFLLFQPNTLEEGADLSCVLMDEQAVDLIIVDSVAAMNPKEVWEKDADQTLTIGALARGMNKFLVKATKLLNNSNVTMLMTNQMMAKIGAAMPGMGPQETQKGGNALKFYKSISLHFTLMKKEKGTVYSDLTHKNEQVEVYNKVKVKNTKNKVADPYRSGELYIRYGYGFDNYLSVLDAGSSCGVLSKSGSTYSYEGVKIGVGLNESAKNLAKPENKNMYDEIVSSLKWDQVTSDYNPEDEITDDDVDFDENDPEGQG